MGESPLKDNPYFCAACGTPTRDTKEIPTGRIIPGGMAEWEWARHIGAVVIIMAELDSAVAGLAGIAAGGRKDDILDAWGQSGKGLAKMLRQADCNDADLTSLADRYDSLYEVRNHIVHSLRPAPESIHDLGVAQRLKQQKTKQPGREIRIPEDLYDERAIGIPELTDVWYQAQDLIHDVRTALYGVLRAQQTDQADRTP